MDRRHLILSTSAAGVVASVPALATIAVAAAQPQIVRLRAEFNAALAVYWAEMARAKEAYDAWQASLPGDLPSSYESAPEYQAYIVASEGWCDATDAVDRVAGQIMKLTPSTASELLVVAHAWAWNQHSGEDGLSCDVAANYRGGELRKLVLFLEDIAQREALT